MSGGPSPPPAAGAPERIETRADLARALTALRAGSGLTVRELARRLDTPPATVGDYVSGRHLPSPAALDLFRGLLRECGVAEEEFEGWVDAVTRLRVTSDGRVGRAATPYRGLEPFRTEDAELFFGREAATDEVLARLRALGGHGGGAALRAAGEGDGPGVDGGWIGTESHAPELDAVRMLLVVGPSGSGKSSLLRAGVVSRVLSGALGGDGVVWSTAVITPGDAPAEALRECLSGMIGPRRLVVVDQFEELFSAPSDQRLRFLAALALLRPPETLLVAALRADFYEAAVREPLLLGALRDAQVLVGPMTEQEVRRAIVEPARQVGVRVADGLVDLLLADLSPGSPTGFAHEAGALPLLSHALLATWGRAQRNELTVSEYRVAGGLRGAVAQSAEDLYEALGPPERELARRIFCRLVRVGDDVPYTRRRVARHELAQLDAPDRDRTSEREDGNPDVLQRFIAARLVTADAETVEISHEALLSAWPRLAEWLDRDRTGLRLRHQLTDAANAWAAGGRDQSLLLRGSRLQVIAEWADEPAQREELNHSERDCLDASLALAEAERRAARLRTRRMQQLLGAVAALGLAAVALAIVAFSARHSADRARDQAVVARDQALTARDQALAARNQALSRQVAIEASDLEPSDSALAMQLALAAYRISPTTQATSTLLDASATEMPTRLLGPIGPTSIALSANGRELAVAYANADEVKLYSLSRTGPTPLAAVFTGDAPTQLFAVALDSDGGLLAAGGTGKQVLLWSLGTLSHPVRIATLRGLGGTVYGLAFGRGDDQLAAADSDGTVRRWSLAEPSHPVAQSALVAPGRPSLQALAYSPDGHSLAAAGANGALAVWRAGGDSRPLAMLTAGATTLTSVAYSPHGDTLVA
ncbi:MAG: helix-turn-helix domain-containing protein, partial [Solirubrobacteraceae bacterium]